MVELSISGDNLHLEVLGWSKLLGFKRSLDLPLKSIKRVTTGTGLPQFRWGDIRVLGTGIPGVVAIGTHWIGSPHRRGWPRVGQWAFFDVTRWSKEVITLDLEGQSYDTVTVEVHDAQSALQMIHASN